MRLSALFIINAVLAVLFGLALLLIPGGFVSLYGGELNPEGIFIARLLGATYLAFGLLTWQVRYAGPSAERRSIILALLVGDAIATLVTLFVQLQGVVNALGWSSFAIFLLLAIGWGYFYFIRPDAS